MSCHPASGHPAGSPQCPHPGTSPPGAGVTCDLKVQTTLRQRVLCPGSRCRDLGIKEMPGRGGGQGAGSGQRMASGGERQATARPWVRTTQPGRLLYDYMAQQNSTPVGSCHLRDLSYLSQIFSIMK